MASSLGLPRCVFPTGHLLFDVSYFVSTKKQHLTFATACASSCSSEAFWHMCSVKAQSINDLRVCHEEIHPSLPAYHIISMSSFEQSHNKSLMLGRTQVLESVHKVRSRTAVILDMGKFSLQVTCSNIYIYY